MKLILCKEWSPVQEMKTNKLYTFSLLMLDSDFPMSQLTTHLTTRFEKSVTFAENSLMFQLGKTIVSEDIIEKDFVCNLSACHGACCVDGDAGAPLNEAETKILEDIYHKVKPFLRQEGIDAIETQGTWVIGSDG